MTVDPTDEAGPLIYSCPFCRAWQVDYMPEVLPVVTLGHRLDGTDIVSPDYNIVEDVLGDHVASCATQSPTNGASS